MLSTIHAFQFAYNLNSPVTFFILYNTLDVPLSANSVVTLLFNSKGWSFLRVVFSQTRNFTVIAFTGWIYCIEFFFTLPWKTEFAVKFSTILNIFFTIQDFWATCGCPQTQSFPWKFSLYWIYFYIQDFWATCACPEKQSVPWIHCIEYIFFYHSGFLSNLRLPWKQGLPWIHSIEYIFFIIQDFWATCACPEKYELPWYLSLYRTVVCLRGGERGTCLGPPLFGGPPLRCYACKFSLLLMKNLLFTHIMYYKADHK